MKKFSTRVEQLLLDEAANPVDRANALACMRSDGIERHEHLIVRLLDHPSPHLRADALRTLLTWDAEEWLPLALERGTEALRALLSWGRQQWAPLALKWVASDRGEHVRSFVAFDLAHAATRFPEHERPIVEALVRVLEHDVSDLVAAKANGALQFLLVPGLSAHNLREGRT